MGKHISVPPMDCPTKGLAPHSYHEWRGGFLWNQKYYCIGMPLPAVTDWRRANPAIGERLDEKQIAYLYNLPRDHRHYYLLKNKVLVTPAGMPVSPDNVYWQCADPFCLDIVSMPREKVRETLLYKRPLIYQTWPG